MKQLSVNKTISLQYCCMVRNIGGFFLWVDEIESKSIGLNILFSGIIS